MKDQKHNVSDHVITLKDGRKLGYCEYGDTNGKPVFYFHGWPGSRLFGIETDEAAKRLKIRIISPDRPGYGLSDYKKGRTLLDWPDDVVELADRLKIKKFAIMGCSGGGPYTAVCAYKIPSRITKSAIVVGLAPVNVPGNLDGMSFLGKISWGHSHRFPGVACILASINSIISHKYFPKLGLLIGFRAKEDRELIKKKFWKRIDNSVGEAFRQGIKGPALDWKIYVTEWGFNLKNIKTKIYLWYGAKDRNVSLNMGKYYKSQIPRSELFVDPNGGHLFRNNIEDKILSKLVD